MEFFKAQVESCHALAFSRLAGEVTAGVGVEVQHAFSKGKPVYEILKEQLIQIWKPVDFLNREQTRALFRRLDIEVSRKDLNIPTNK